MKTQNPAFAEQQKAGYMQTKTAARQTYLWYLGLKGILMFSMSLHFSIYSTFLLSKGLSLLDINLVNVFFFVTLFIFEIPTGALADVFGRKFSIVMAGVFNTLGTLMYFLSKGFWGFAAAESILAIGSTFLSGAFTAWAIDRLKHYGHNADLKILFTRENQVVQTVVILGGLFGAFISTKNISLTWLVSSLIFVVWTALAAFGLKEEYFIKKKFSYSSGLKALKSTARSSIQFGIKHKTIRFILLIGVLQTFCLMPINMQWQPWFGQFFKSISENGWLWVVMSLVILLGSSLAPLFMKRVKNEALAISIVQVMLGVSMAAAVFFKILPYSLPIFLLHELGRGLFKPIKDAYLNDQIPSKERATVVSFEAIAHHVGGGVGLVLSGITAMAFGLAPTWILFGIILSIGSMLIFKTNKP